MAKKKEYIYKDVVYDSKEEIEFKVFLEEATQHGFIKNYIYQPPSYELIPKATYKDSKGKTKTLFRSHSYTADWIIYPTPLFEELNHNLKISKDGTYIIDIKGLYNRNGGDRILAIHQKLLYDKHKLILNKVNPEDFFKTINIAPEGLRWNLNVKKEKRLKKAFKNLDTFEEFLDKIKIKHLTGKQININYLG
jgi:hypothetical protein